MPADPKSVRLHRSPICVVPVGQVVPQPSIQNSASDPRIWASSRKHGRAAEAATFPLLQLDPELARPPGRLVHFFIDALFRWRLNAVLIGVIAQRHVELRISRRAGGDRPLLDYGWDRHAVAGISLRAPLHAWRRPLGPRRLRAKAVFGSAQPARLRHH